MIRSSAPSAISSSTTMGDSVLAVLAVRDCWAAAVSAVRQQTAGPSTLRGEARIGSSSRRAPLRPPGGMLTTSFSSVTCLNRRGRRSEIDDPAMHREAVDDDERRDAGIGDPAQPDLQPGATHGDRRKKVDAERIQLDVAVEAIFERRHDELPQWFGARACRRQDRQHEQRADNGNDDPECDFSAHYFSSSRGRFSGVQEIRRTFGSSNLLIS